MSREAEYNDKRVYVCVYLSIYKYLSGTNEKT